MTQDANGEPVLQFLMNEADALSFAALTGGHIGETMSVSIFGQELVAPVIRERIAGGAGTIRISTMTQAEELALALAGDAPCPGD